VLPHALNDTHGHTVQWGLPGDGSRSTPRLLALAPGEHWLGLRLYGADGGVEDWTEQVFEIPAR